MKSNQLFSLLIVLFFWGQVQAQSTTPLTRDQAFAEVQSNMGSMFNGLSSRDISPEEYGDMIYTFAEDFYSQGFISLAQLNTKRSQVPPCISAENHLRSHGPHSSGLDFANLHSRNDKCGIAGNFTAIKSPAPACVQTTFPLYSGKTLSQLSAVVAAGAQCCSNTKIGVSNSLENALAALNPALKKTSSSCTSHAECASKRCEKDEGAVAGVCAAVMTCFPLIPLGGECTAENMNCLSGICRVQEIGTPVINCKPTGNQCASGTDCCSGKCTSGKCEDRMICEDCTAEGGTPTAQKKCCPGLIKDLDNLCILEMPPFVLPSASVKPKPSLLNSLVANINLFSTAYAQAPEVNGGSTGGGEQGNTSQQAFTNDAGLTLAQLNTIEDRLKTCMEMSNDQQRKTCLIDTYKLRTQMLAQNNAALKAGQKLAKTFTQEEYVKRYNIPSIVPKTRSNVEQCEFDTGKDNWIDSSNMLRNAELFMRAFEVSYSGPAVQDKWHLPDASWQPNAKNIYTRTKEIMKEVRDNRNYQRDQLKYLDLLMACQCMYTFGPEKFSQEKQTFFFSMCTGSTENKICRDGEQRDSFKMPDSTEAAYQDGTEFPNYVQMYLDKLTKMAGQASATSGKGKATSSPNAMGDGVNSAAAGGGFQMAEGDIDNLDAGAAGINHEEVLVRWLRLRSCNQIDIFMDAEAVETELQDLVEGLNRAKKPVPRLTNYWSQRIAALQNAGTHENILKSHYFTNTEKNTWFRGYVDTESRFNTYTKKKPKFLFFLIMLLLAAVFIVFLPGVLIAAGSVLGMVIAGTLFVALGIVGLATSGGKSGGAWVIESFVSQFPDVLVEDRLVNKSSCGFLKLFWCMDFTRLMHWPAYSNQPGIESAIPFSKNPPFKCEQILQMTSSLGHPTNPCSGPFKGTMCANSFLAPRPDEAIANKADFAPWKVFMRDKMLMDPVFPEFFKPEGLDLNPNWVPEVRQGFNKGCVWLNKLGKGTAKPEHKLEFLPDFPKYFNQSVGDFKDKYIFKQLQIDNYKKAIKEYALCKDLRGCGAQNYDGRHPAPIGFGDIFDKDKYPTEATKNAEMFADYVFQIHFTWRHMSGKAGIGYPLSFGENYYMTLLHNLRLLTTLSVRRGLELDDTYNKYAEDLAVRRSRYQITGKKYGIEMGDEARRNYPRSQVYDGLRALGFPLSSDFQGLQGMGGLNTNSSINNKGAGSLSLNQFTSSALAAASRHADRVAKDNKKWKNFKDQIKGNKDAERRLANTKNFFSNVNNAVGSIPGLANKKDSSFYSGIGGKLSSGSSSDDKKESEPEQKFGPVATEQNKGSGAGSGSGLGSGMGAGSNANSAGDGMEGVNLGLGDADGTAGADAGAQGGAGDEGGFGYASKVTGMQEGDVANMLESADKNRDKLGSGEDDSLFQRLSKAYIRNLDRVLVRKKGSTKAEGAKKPEVDQEKEEIKKLFK